MSDYTYTLRSQSGGILVEVFQAWTGGYGFPGTPDKVGCTLARTKAEADRYISGIHLGLDLARSGIRLQAAKGPCQLRPRIAGVPFELTPACNLHNGHAGACEPQLPF